MIQFVKSPRRIVGPDKVSGTVTFLLHRYRRYDAGTSTWLKKIERFFVENPLAYFFSLRTVLCRYSTAT